MAKKRADTVNATQAEKASKPVRLEISTADHQRLERVAESRGLSMSAYARQAVLRQIRLDEREDAG